MNPSLNVVGYVCTFCFFAVVLWAIIAYFVFRRAEELEMDPHLWAIIVFFLQPFGLIIFLLASWEAARDQKQRGVNDFHKGGNIYGELPNGRAQSLQENLPQDPNFVDDYLEELINDRKLSEARKYLSEMIRMTREMGNEEGLRNYSKYESKIKKATMDSTRRDKE